MNLLSRSSRFAPAAWFDFEPVAWTGFCGSFVGSNMHVNYCFLTVNLCRGAVCLSPGFSCFCRRKVYLRQISSDLSLFTVMHLSKIDPCCVYSTLARSVK